MLVTTAAVSSASGMVAGSADATQAALMSGVPEVIAYYSDGSSALAADHYDDLRDAANAPGRYTAEPIALLREEKIRTGVLWAVEPLYRPEPDRVLALSRVGEVVQYEVAQQFRRTITTNTRRDPAAVGWQRITSGGCKFCSMLGGRGAVYRESSARFASHPGCKCTAAPVFDGQPGQEASVMQYVASQKSRTPQQQQVLRDYLAKHF